MEQPRISGVLARTDCLFRYDKPAPWMCHKNAGQLRFNCSGYCSGYETRWAYMKLDLSVLNR